MRTIFIVCLLVVSVMSDARKITDIESLYKASDGLEVVGLEYSSDATTLTFRTTKACTPTLKVGHGIYIVDDNGQRHHAIGSEGIKLDSLYVMVKGQSRNFSISFDPVDVDNKLLDVRDPGFIVVYGLHDRNDSVIIPKVECCIDSDEYRFLQSGENGFVEIEGTFHSSDVVDGTVLYFDYDCLDFQIEEDLYAKVNKDGHFKLRFMVGPPQAVLVKKGYANSGEYLGYLYLRPGDKIHLDLYDVREGKDMSVRNLSGRKTYERLCGLINRQFFFNISDYIEDIWTNFTHLGYDAHNADLWNCYNKDMEFVNYLCWHNGCSPFESHMLFTNLKETYVCQFLMLDLAVKNLYSGLKVQEQDAILAGLDDEFDGSDTVRFLQYMDKMDYSYLKLLDSDDLTCMSQNDYFHRIVNMIAQLKPLVLCHDVVAKDDENRWMKIIDLQREELNRLAGWTDFPFVAQVAIASDYPQVFGWKPADEKLYQQVRALLTNPYCKKLLDCRHQQMLERVKAKGNTW